MAIKILPRYFTSDPERLVRFEREARVLASLNHPHIGAIYGLEDADGVRALVLELVDGETLADRISRGPIAVKDALRIAREITEALDAAHEKGIVHRDLKPANIKITHDGVVKVLDFGLAKAVSGDPATADLTQSPTMTVGGTREGVILGTAAYMSPEQARGLTVDKRTDIWAFGCVVYDMLTGGAAFARDTITDTLAAIVEREPDWAAMPPATPPRVRRLLRRCVEKDPRRRLRDIGDARVELDDTVDPASPALVSRRSTRIAWSTAAVTGVIAVVAVSWMSISGTSSRASSTASALGPGARLTRLTWDPVFAIEPALSRDGTLVTYASDQNSAGNLDLWVQRVAGDQPVRLTEDPADDREPDFSPDGGSVAFRSDRNGGGVYVMPALGGDARLVAEFGRRPRFSPEGTRIAYWTGPWLGGPRTAGTSVFVVAAIGGQPREISKGFAVARNPVWSPDGQSVLFFGRKDSAVADDAFDWWWAPVTGGEPVRTGAYAAMRQQGLDVSGTDPLSEPVPGVWVPDGAVFSALLGQAVNLWRVRVAPRTGSVEGSLVRLTTGTGEDREPSIDASGRIVYRSAQTDEGMFALPLDPVAAKPLGSIERLAGAWVLGPQRGSVSEDGRWLAFPKHRPPMSEVWVKDLMTGRERHLATTPRSPLDPVISRDGSRVAYTVVEGGRSSGYVVPVAGGATQRVCEPCALSGWFADGRRILITSVGRGGAIQILDVDAGSSVDPFGPGAPSGRLELSWDNRWLAVTEGGRLWIAPLRAGQTTLRTEWNEVPLPRATNVAGRATGWSPDGRLLYLLLDVDGFRCLYAQRVDADRGKAIGEPFAVQHFHQPQRNWGSTPLSMGIIRRAFIFDQYELTGSIWLMDPLEKESRVN